MPDLIVVGAGAAGLSAAIGVARSGFSVQVIEARSRIGGRIFTQPRPGLESPSRNGSGIHPRIAIGDLETSRSTSLGHRGSSRRALVFGIW